MPQGIRKETVMAKKAYDHLSELYSRAGSSSVCSILDDEWDRTQPLVASVNKIEECIEIELDKARDGYQYYLSKEGLEMCDNCGAIQKTRDIMSPILFASPKTFCPSCADTVEEENKRSNDR